MIMLNRRPVACSISRRTSWGRDVAALLAILHVSLPELAPAATAARRYVVVGLWQFRPARGGLPSRGGSVRQRP